MLLRARNRFRINRTPRTRLCLRGFQLILEKKPELGHHRRNLAPINWLYSKTADLIPTLVRGAPLRYNRNVINRLRFPRPGLDTLQALSSSPIEVNFKCSN